MKNQFLFDKKCRIVFSATFLPPCFMGFCARERRSPRREGYLFEIDWKKSGFSNRAFCKVGSVLGGTLLRARICVSVVVCHLSSRSAMRSERRFPGAKLDRNIIDKSRRGEIVSRDALSCGEFENGLRARRRWSARQHWRNENAKKLFLESCLRRIILLMGSTIFSSGKFGKIRKVWKGALVSSARRQNL